MRNILAVTKLHFNKRALTFLAPAGIILMAMVVTFAITLIAQRAGVASEIWSVGARNNMGVLCSIIGFLVYLGVQAVSTTFPFALALGATRRAFTLGTLLWSVAVSAYVAVITTILLGIELATSHWGFSAYVFDVYTLGSGNPVQLFLTMFLVTLTSLSLGGIFGAVWVRFGSRGPLVLGTGLGLVLVGTLVILAPSLGSVFESVRAWHVGIAAVVVVIAASIAEITLLRRASVR